MSEKSSDGAKSAPSDISELEILLREKDNTIEAQAQRIKSLEVNVDQLSRDRDLLRTKLALLSHKLTVTSQQNMDVSRENTLSRHSESKVASPPPPPVRAGSQLSTPPPRLLHGTPSPQNSPGGGGANGIRVQRQRSSHKSRDDEEKIKRSRAWANAYELSQDLHEKQLEMLERKYGGQLRARRAARIIQQAYRKHKLSKNFEKLRCEVEEKRLSRRFAEHGRSKTIWSDMVASVESSMPHGSNIHVRHCTGSSVLADHQFLSHSHEDHLNQNSPNSSTGTVRTIRVMHKSHSLSVATRESFVSRERRPLNRGLGLDLSSTNKPNNTAMEDNNNRGSFSEMNDSSASDSPQDTPVEPSVDLPSVNFENLLESKETDILNDSFHSDSSHDSHRHSTADSGATLVPQEEIALCEKCRSPMTDSVSSVEDLLLTPEDAERTPTQEDACVVTKIYANTEVRLRKRKCAQCGKHSPEPSPIWKRKSHVMSSSSSFSDDLKRMSNISEASEPDSLSASREGLSTSSSDTASLNSGGLTYHAHSVSLSTGAASSPLAPLPPKLSDRQRKRAYRIGLNLFNKKPEKGIKFLVEQRFVEHRPSAVAKVLITRKGLSKQMIGEYLGNIQNQFNMDVLHCFGEEIDLSGLQIDVALRKFQSHFRMPGEAQKIERLMEAFANRYVECNHDQVKQFSSADTVFLLAFAIIMLNTDLHNKSIRSDRKMKLPDFIKNLRGIDGGADVDPDILSGIYSRIKATEFKPGTDQVTQVHKVEQMIVGTKPTQQLSLPHRRLVCYCRLYEVSDPNKREKLGLHQREVFLFNDVLMVTKIFSKKKKHVSYTFRVSFSLCGMQVYLFETSHYKHGIRLTTNIDGKVLITFNARNEHDRSKFVEDLKEAILEMNEMESMRIDDELHKQKMTGNHLSFNRFSKDSGVVDLDLLKPGDPGINRLSAPECSGLKKSALSNSLIELSESNKRRGSGGSLDSGLMSAAPSASSDSQNGGSQEDNQKTLKPHQSAGSRFSIFGKKAKSSRSSLAADCTSEA